jgi:Kef-type K+ transport system membrane component KefB
MAVTPPLSFEAFLQALLLVLVSAKLLGQACQRLGQSSVLGELLAGVLLSALGWLPQDHVLELLAELGLLILLFEIGLETDITQLMQVGRLSVTVAVVGVLFPFVGGLVLGLAAGWAWTTALLIGAAFSATSIGVTARILRDNHQQHSMEGRIVLGAAFLDDIFGLLILALLSAMVTQPGGADLGYLFTIAVTTLLFPAVAIGLGVRCAPVFVHWVDKLSVRGGLGIAGLSLAFALSYLATVIKSASVIGAFAAGLVLAKTHRAEKFIAHLQPIADLLTPIFFVMVGAKLNLALLNPANPANHPVWVWALLGTFVAFAGKFASGYVGIPGRLRRHLIGVAMIPRGEVGLVVAELGRRSGVFDAMVFGVVLLVVMATTAAGPLLLKSVLSKPGGRSKPNLPELD